MKKRCAAIAAIVMIAMIAVLSTMLCGCSVVSTTHAYMGDKDNKSDQSDQSDISSSFNGFDNSEGGTYTEDPESNSELHTSSAENGSQNSQSSQSSGNSKSDVPDPSYDGSVNDENIYYALRDNEKKFVSESLFVGDSICKGFMTYNVLPPENVFATGSVATRNIFEMDFFYYGENRKFTDVISEKDPKYVLFSMGMNDVNMITPKQFCENYSEIISLVTDKTNADVFICAITPICSGFTPAGRIESFNSEIKKFVAENYDERVHFVDFTEPLKNKEGRLKSYFSGGDGIHLSPEAYYAAFHELYSIVSASDYFNTARPEPDSHPDQSEDQLDHSEDQPDQSEDQPDRFEDQPDRSEDHSDQFENQPDSII